MKKKYIILIFTISIFCIYSFGNNVNDSKKTKVIFITDLYHPHQDFGDNFDIIAPYALPEIDLIAVILDVTEEFRTPVSAYDKNGPREPGIIPITQLNYIFDKNVPFGIGPFNRMKTSEDKMEDIPEFQQSGIELLLSILGESDDRVEIISTGSARALAVAYNRNPSLFLNKVNRIHLSAGSSSPEFQEWNVMLDPLAIYVLLRSKLPIVIYPCATAESALDKGINNTYWKLNNMDFLKELNFKLQNYIEYAFSKSSRIDFLRAMDDTVPTFNNSLYNKTHNVWETAIWQQAANRKLVKNSSGQFRIVPENQIGVLDSIFAERLIPCNLIVNKDGLFEFTKTEKSNFFIYERDNPIEYEKWMQDALKALYISFLRSSPY
jgi:pyrimidine-specific ribonucleoside hydrolase